MKDNLQDKLLENVIYDDNNKDENTEKVMLSTTELLKKDKRIEILINNIGKQKEELLMGKKKEVFNVNVGRDMSPNKKT